MLITKPYRKACHSPRQQGFTLIEVLVVVMILAILAAVVLPKMMSHPEKAAITAAKAQIAIIETQMDAYRMDNFQYPSTTEGIKALVTKPAGATDNWSAYLKRVPIDPWGNEYKYMNPGTHGEIDIYSSGPPKSPQDIGNWKAKK